VPGNANREKANVLEGNAGEKRDEREEEKRRRRRREKNKNKKRERKKHMCQ
jgi:hypothetical protein